MGISNTRYREKIKDEETTESTCKKIETREWSEINIIFSLFIRKAFLLSSYNWSFVFIIIWKGLFFMLKSEIKIAKNGGDLW